jgi:hypothetical protein
LQILLTSHDFPNSTHNLQAEFPKGQRFRNLPPNIHAPTQIRKGIVLCTPPDHAHKGMGRDTSIEFDVSFSASSELKTEQRLKSAKGSILCIRLALHPNFWDTFLEVLVVNMTPFKHFATLCLDYKNLNLYF